jgi:hypothetical protein
LGTTARWTLSATFDEDMSLFVQSAFVFSKLSSKEEGRKAASNCCNQNRMKNEPLMHLFAKSSSRSDHMGTVSPPNGFSCGALGRDCD